MSTGIRQVACVAFVLLVQPGLPRAGEASDKVARALSGADAKLPTVSFPALAPLRAAREARNKAYRLYLNSVDGLLRAKARAMGGPRSTGKVAICFDVGPDGRVSQAKICEKSGDPRSDKQALAVVSSSGPLPPPPPPSQKGLIWVYSFDAAPRAETR